MRRWAARLFFWISFWSFVGAATARLNNTANPDIMLLISVLAACIYVAIKFWNEGDEA